MKLRMSVRTVGMEVVGGSRIGCVHLDPYCKELGDVEVVMVVRIVCEGLVMQVVWSRVVLDLGWRVGRRSLVLNPNCCRCCLSWSLIGRKG